MDELKPPGLAEDLRTPEQKEKDYKHEEVAPAAVALHWDRDISGAPQYSVRDQNGSSSCVGQATGKALEAILGDVFSAHPIYARRKNFPGLGMWMQDAGDILYKQGTTTEVKDPSQNMSEDQLNAPVGVETPINKYMYAFIGVTDIDKIAEAIEVRKHCLITFYGNIDEYAYSDKPVVNPAAPLNCAHCICGIYYFKDEHGEKCILIEESWGPNNIRRRVLTESYLKARGTGAMYYIKPVNPVEPNKPHFRFQTVLEYGQTNYSIKMLQDILKYENLFPINIPSTGYYGQVTAKAVLAFQIKYKVAPESELNQLAGKRVGPKTIAKLNELYSQ